MSDNKKKRRIQRDEWTAVFECTVGKCRVRRHVLAPITREHQTEAGFPYPEENVGRALVVDVNLSYDPEVSGKAWTENGVITDLDDPMVARVIGQVPTFKMWKIFEGGRPGCGTTHRENKLLGTVEFPSHMSQLDVLKHLIEVEGYPDDIFSNFDGLKR